MVLELARGRSQYYLPFAVGVEPGWSWVGEMGRDTLLSPEASAVRQSFSGPPGPVYRECSLRGVWWVAWVGVFLVNWIVDASIFRGGLPVMGWVAVEF
ncbi:hypothetical protein GCM10009795_100230 [Nocardioides hankookensis]